MTTLLDDLSDLTPYTLTQNPEIGSFFELEYISAIPGDEITASEWAVKYRVMTSETSALSGPWHADSYPHANGIMDAMSSGACREIIIVGGTQNAKSESYINFVGYTIHQHPRSIMLVLPTESKTEEMIMRRIKPMIENSSDGVLQKRCDLGGKKIKEDGLQYPGGILYPAWATSASTLSSRPVAIVIIDEEDEMKPSAQYGDPVELAKERPKSFPDALIVRVGKPMSKDGIQSAAKSADYQFKRYVACPHCGAEFLFELEGLRPKGLSLSQFKGGAYYECPHCSEKITEENRKSMLVPAVWRTKDGDYLDTVLELFEKLTISFHISSFYAPFITFDDMMTAYLKAKKKGSKGLKVFYEGMLAINYDSIGSISDDDIRIISEHLRDYTPEMLPAGVCLLTAAVDVQKHRLEVLVKGWGRNSRNWHILHKVISGMPQSSMPWKELDKLLAHRFPHPCGLSMPIYCCVVDSGYEADHVYAYTKKREGRNVYSIKGGSHQSAPLVSKSKLDGSVKAQLFILNSHKLKHNVYDYLQDTAMHLRGERDNDFIGLMEFNESCKPWYFDQLTSETLIISGASESFELKEGFRNEILDMTAYNEGALYISGVNIEEWADQMEAAMAGGGK